jgi:NAD(P)-dependent dehydrogenase (short-subunit alcohol dehydrogenase family)
MNVDRACALVTGGASGLGEATVRALTAKGAHVLIADISDQRGEALAEELGSTTAYIHCDVAKEMDVEAAGQKAVDHFGQLNLAVGCAGIGHAGRMTNRDGAPAGLDDFRRVIDINLTGMFNLLQHASAAMQKNDPGENGERGLVLMTSSIAAFDGQIGQTAYAASKGGVAALTLPAARELSRGGVRVMTIAPGLFDTPLLAGLPEPARKALGEGVPFPARLGDPAEYAQLVCSIAENTMLNGETIRLDGALRMPPR